MAIINATGVLGVSSITAIGGDVQIYNSLGGSGRIQVGQVTLVERTNAVRDAIIGTARGTLIYNATTATVQYYDGTGWYDTNRSFVQATGGLVSDYLETSSNRFYRAHVFTTSGNFTVTNSGPGTVECLVVAGGGGGGNATGTNWGSGGGGGAGGFRTSNSLGISANTTYAVIVGGGGAGNNFGQANDNGTPGADSIFSTITSSGGGKGGSANFNGAPGGSGGGSGYIAGRTGGTGNHLIAAFPP